MNAGAWTSFADTLADGSPFRIWALVDDATREAPQIVVDRNLPAAGIIEALELLVSLRQAPRTIVCDSGPEFVSLVMDQWASSHEIRLDYIRPGRPSRTVSSRASTASCEMSA